MASKLIEKEVSKLPKWAQEHIKDLKRERDMAVRTLREFEDGQTKSDVFYEESVCLGEQRGPSSVIRYLQTRHVTFKVGKREAYICFDREGCLVVNTDRGLLFKPRAGNSIEIIPEDWVLPKEG